MAWSRRQLSAHRAAAKLLEQVRDEIFGYLRAHRRSSEREVQEFALRRFARYGLHNELSRPIVAFREHTGVVHYFPPARRSYRLRPGSGVLLDLWARLNQPRAPYADLTWMAWAGRPPVPAAFRRTFAAVQAARDSSLRYLGLKLRHGRVPSGRSLDAVARRRLDAAGYRGRFSHGLGHSLGLTGPHGPAGALAPKNRRPLVRGMGYTIEPGVYLPGQFGVRLEMNFFLSRDGAVVVTSDVQREIVRL